MELTTHQITTLVLGILLPMVLLLAAAYAGGNRQGRLLAAAAEYTNGYEAGKEEQAELVAALQEDIGTLNSRMRLMSATLAHTKEGHELSQKHLAGALEYCAALQDEAEQLMPRALNDDDLTHLGKALALLASEAKRIQKTGSNKVNRAQLVHQHLSALHARATASDWRHPDTELIEWLEVAASVHADEEHGELRFPLFANRTGYAHVRDMIRDAQQQDEATQRNHQASLEAAA